MAYRVYSPSLEGVCVGESAISLVEGEQGWLLYRGVPIEELRDMPVLNVAARLACKTAPGPEQLAGFEAFIRAHSVLRPVELATLNTLPPGLHPMLMLQTMMPLLASASQPELPLNLQAADIQHGFALAAKIPALLCYWRARELGCIEPEHIYTERFAELCCIQAFLEHYPGADNGAKAQQLLNTTQVLQMEHSYNASTFAGRVCASTDAPVESVLSASIGTLFGPLHGGADQAALEMALSVARPEQAESYVSDCLANGIRIMGMGHREYKVLDPRAKVLKPMAAELVQGNPQHKQLFDTLVAVEESCQKQFAAKGKRIHANVEYYKGMVFHALGIPSHYFTALFAMARVYGYLAHYEEFRLEPRLIRPRARYAT